MDITSSSYSQNARRKVLNCSIAAILYQNGFSHADKGVVETLVEILQAFLMEIGRSTRSIAELGGRTQTMPGDVVLALIEMGINIDSIPSYYYKNAMASDKLVVNPPVQAPRIAAPKILQAGEKKSHLSYIPEYLPPFPDPHSYIRTCTHKQPVTEYEAIREKSASQKRDVERALTKFMAKTSDQSMSHSLFPDDYMNNMFPLIALKPIANPYLNALLPKDQLFDGDEDDPEPKLMKVTKSEENLSQATSADGDSSLINGDKTIDSDVPDNPYLRPPKISKKSKK